MNRMDENEFENVFLTLDEVAEQLRVSVTTVRRWISEDQLPAYKPGRRILVRQAELDQWLAGQRVSEVPGGS